MGKFDPTSLSKDELEKAVRSGKLSSYYLDNNTLIKEISCRNGGYVLKLIERIPGSAKEHIQMDFVYDSEGKLIDKHFHKY